MSDASDRALALRARRGDADAFGELVRRYQTSVFNVCYRLLGERREAEDLAQEAFIRAYERLATYDPDRPFGPWMRRVAANLCLNRLEGTRSQLASVSLDEERDDPPAARETEPEPRREQAEQAQALRAAILSLPSHYRVVIELRHFQELSYDEIAQTLRLPVSDVKSHLFRARKALAQKLGRG
ncbi:MAG: sigma-70 family RNA polymerase sigma factor [Anaerolineales bacterium]